MEEWKPIKDYNYEVSSFGKVRNKETKKILSVFDVNREGYLRVILFKNHKRKRFFIHRLVAEAFIPNPENKPQVNHKNGNKQNNNLRNLEWVNASENMIHSYYVLRNKTGFAYKKGVPSHKHTGKYKTKNKVYPNYHIGDKMPKEIHIKLWKTRHKKLQERNKKVFDLLRQGKSILEISKCFNLSRRQVYTITREVRNESK